MENEIAVNPPTAFVSYSWCNVDHKAWVADLSYRLRANGVDVHLDRWDVAIGHDLNLFMEKYADPTARVLVILSDDYAPKADGRGENFSGVGTEATIVSATVYNDLGGNRVIPVVPSSGTVAGKPLVPRYLVGRSWIDFRENYEGAYEQLLRELHGVPLEPAPPLGKNPFTGRTAAQATAAIRNDPARWHDGRSAGHLKINLNENSGNFLIGNSDYSFHLHLQYPFSTVHPASPKIVRHYRDYFDKIGLVKNGSQNIDRFQSVPDLPMSNRAEETTLGDVVVMLNREGHWAIMILDDVEITSGPNGMEPVACFRYVIATDRSADLTFHDLPQQSS